MKPAEFIKIRERAQTARKQARDLRLLTQLFEGECRRMEDRIEREHAAYQRRREYQRRGSLG